MDAQTGSIGYISRPHLAVSRPVALWHVLLGAVALLNVALWFLSAAAVARGAAPGLAGMASSASLLQLLLSGGYVLGCAFRSILPVYDIPRIVLVDSRLSNVVVGRSVATIAELCFAAQWSVMLHHLALLSHSPVALAASLAIVPLIVVAEICSWHSVLTTDQRGHMAENSLWGMAAVMVVAGLLVIGPHRLTDLSAAVIVWSVGGAAYALFIFCFDVPMYWARWRADRRNGRPTLSLTQGIADTCQRRVVSYRWQDWRHEVLWMSLYFSGGVWSSISLVYASLALTAHGH